MSGIKEPSRERTTSAAPLLKALEQAAGLVGLYRGSHPVPQKAADDAFGKLEKLLSGRPEGRLTISEQHGHWLVDGRAVPEAGEIPRAFSNMFLSGGFASLRFEAGVKHYEVRALCDIVANHSPEQWRTGEAADLFVQRGVKHILLEAPASAARGRSSGTASASAPARPGKPAPATKAAAPSPRFGDFLKNLVEEAVKDPGQRRDLYQQALKLVKRSLDAHVAAATAQLAQEKRRILAEQRRTESVLSTVADGKVIVDKDGKVLMMNPAAEKISGRSLAQLAGRPIAEHLDPAKQILALSGDASQEVQVSGQDDIKRTFRESSATVHDEGGRVIGTLSVLPNALKTQQTLELQKDFVARVSHELRAPLSALCAALEVVTDKAWPKLGPEERGFLETCQRNSEQLQRMVADILDFSRLEAGQLTVRPVPSETDAVIAAAVTGLRPWAAAKGIALESAPVAKGFPQVLADHQRLVQVLNNLISNAIKCTPAGGRVEVGVDLRKSLDGGAALFWVRDTGCGIAKEDQRRIFEKFVQLPGSGGFREGAGLGLTIVANIVKQHKGKIFIDSAVGKGTTLSFAIPLAGAV